ncbi:peroxisomal membrane protein PEX14 isoform X1 [Harmonia axyridis]|uniref:peroxisomal membrane protein PEX14 isoform X1 n=2 Tax=Harmonia axyridis TaxID=115357 RepID=UPI001E2797A4|nr:peroxisomal membrane protein PEX14 isoform X1 [Harmonia axyridis]
MTSDSSNTESQAARQELVRTAVSFLQNPKVQNTPLAKKQEFLQRKGLTNDEIKKACELSGAYQQHEQQMKIPPPLPIAMNGNQLQLTFFHKLKEILHNLAVLSIVGYTLYKLYQRFIAPYLFGRKKSVDESIEKLDKEFKKSVAELKTSLDSVKIEVDKISQNSDWNNERYLSDIKSDLSTVKGLLLGRKQFPSVSNSPVVPPSIPAWQMSSVADASDGDTDHKTEDIEEVGSGSGSSEPEHYTKTSESSLEILSLPKDCENVSYSCKEDQV